MSYLNWNPGHDPYLKPKEKVLHEKLHAIRADKVENKQALFAAKQVRIDAINFLINKHEISLSGDILEVGAGDGWCAAYLLDNFEDIDAMYVMECTESAVTELIPATMRSVGVDHLDIRYILGSFNDIRLTDTFDHVFAMGALHHSANLYATMQQLYSSLKPGGSVISHEPYMVDTTPNSYYVKHSEIVKDFGIGIKIKNSERTDLFYRKCEYAVAAYHAGFDVVMEELIVNQDSPSAMVMMLKKPEQVQPLPPVTAWERSDKV